MIVRMIIGAILLISGIAMFAMSDYITAKVAIGRGDIYRAQSNVNTINSLVDNTSQVQGLGGLVTSPVQGKIDEGTHTANYYARLAAKLKIGGIVLSVIGVIVLIFSALRRRFHHQ